MEAEEQSYGAAVGARVRQARTELGWSMTRFAQDVSEVLGRRVPRQSIDQIERGSRRFDTDELLAFAFVLKVPASRLLTILGPGCELRRGTDTGYAFDRDEILQIVRGDEDAEQRRALIEHLIREGTTVVDPPTLRAEPTLPRASVVQTTKKETQVDED